MTKCSKSRRKNTKCSIHPLAVKQKKTSLKWLVVLGYLIYLLMIIMTQLPFIAEQVSYRAILNDDLIEYHLIFTADGYQSHYYIERANQSLPGTIDVYYYPESNTLKTNSVNIVNLTIYCRSMYYDECKDVFGFDPNENSNYYKWFFIEKDHLIVNIISDSNISTLKFVDAPKPSLVIVDSVRWTEGKEYHFKPSEGIALSNVSVGMTNVDIYFKSPPAAAPVAQITASRTRVYINESLVLDGSGSYDPKPNGYIANYIWDYGEGNFSSGANKDSVTYKYPTAGTFGVILTVVDNNYNLGHAYVNITVISDTSLRIRSRVPDITLAEDSPTKTVSLRSYEPYSEQPAENYFWYITGEDSTLYSISGENSSEDNLMITPKLNQFGNNHITLWLVNIKGEKVCQPLWINITPVNDAPTIFGIPDITIHYDVPYTFNYLLYISDFDTPISELTLNSSDTQHTEVNGFNVTYNYPKSMLGRTEYVILTIWDGQRESSDVVGVWITDDWVPNLVEPLPDVYLDEGEVRLNYFDLDDYFMDPDNDTLYYSYGYTHVNVVINTNHSVDFYAPNDWNGEEMTTFRATDPSGALIEDIITVIVRPINDPPIIQNVPNLIVRYEQDYIFDVSPYIYDEDTPLEELTLTTSDPAHIRIFAFDHLTLILNYPLQQDMPYTKMVTLTVSDGMNSSFQIITVFVKDNYPPVLIKQFKEIVMYEDVPKLNVLNFYDYFKDFDSSMLYFKVINNDKIISYINVNGSLDLSSAANWSGCEVITFRAIDPDMALAEAMVEVSVLPVNDPPVLLDIPKQMFNKSEKHKLDLYPYLFDIDNNLTQLEIWLEDCSIDYEVHGTDIIFYATEPKTTTATIIVSDGCDETSQKILIEVSGSGPAPRSLFFELLILVIIVVIMIAGIFAFAYRNYHGNYEVIELFVIYKNGIMVLHHSNEDVHREETDADIISAMFTAVQDFTRDSFANGNVDDESWSLKRLEFQKNNILVERGEYMYIAAVFSGNPGKRLGRELNRVRTEIEIKYASILPKWVGEVDELEGINELVECHNLIARPEVKPPMDEYTGILQEESKPKSH
ncbi:PKD domain-containing protein [[Eubacterium] cellulosolvens]